MTEKPSPVPERPRRPKTLEEIRWQISLDNPEVRAHFDRLQLAIDRLGEIAERARAAR